MRRKAQAKKITLVSVDHENDEIDFFLENTQNELTNNNNSGSIINITQTKIDLITECDLNCMQNLKRKSIIMKPNEETNRIEKRFKQQEVEKKYDYCSIIEENQLIQTEQEVEEKSLEINESTSDFNYNVSLNTSLNNTCDYFIGNKIEDISVKCSYCGKSFASNSGLKQHMHIHGSVKPYMCDQCPKAYTQFSNLCRHKRSHYAYENSFTCRFCHLSFDSLLDLDKHKYNCKRKKKVKTMNENSS